MKLYTSQILSKIEMIQITMRAVFVTLINATGQPQYNKKETTYMQLIPIKSSSFFHQPSLAQLRLFTHSEKLLQAFFSETPEAVFLRKITLTDQYIVISDKVCGQYEPTLFLKISDSITFQKLKATSDLKTKGSSVYGFSLIFEWQQTIRIYLQFQALSDLWIVRLAACINRVGFQDEYKMMGRVGKGSTSTVFKVQRLADGKIYAAKVFLKSYLKSKPQRKTSVFNQISLLRAITHNNILKIIEVYESTSSIYIITEFLEGGTLFERINQNRGFKLIDVKKIIKGIIQGLAYMHKFGIMHRDIKLENIMLRSKETIEIVIVDFGLAAMSEDEAYIFYRCGTPGYIAPEIIGMQSNGRIDPICDIFSAGVILHILMTNRYLFEGKDHHEVYKNNKHLNFDLDDDRYNNLDDQGMNLLSQMLEIDHQERINAEEILNHEFLDELAEGTSEKEEISPAITMTGEEEFVF